MLWFIVAVLVVAAALCLLRRRETLHVDVYSIEEINECPFPDPQFGEQCKGCPYYAKRL